MRRRDAKYIVSGYTKRPHPFDSNANSICDWFDTNKSFPTKEEALAYIAAKHSALISHGKTPHWSYREEFVNCYGSDFTYSEMPMRLFLKKESECLSS